MQNAFPIQAFRRFSQSLIADASDLIGFDKGVHEDGEFQEITIRTPDGQAATLSLTHFCIKDNVVQFWEFTHNMNRQLKAIIFND